MSDSPLPSDPHPDSRRGILAFLALVSVFVSQIFLYVLPEDSASVAMSVFWIAIAGICLFLASQFLHLPKGMKISLGRFALPVPAMMILVGFVLSILASIGMILFEKYGRTNYIPVVTLWLGGALCYLCAFLTHRKDSPDFRKLFRSHWKEAVAVILVTALAFVLRFYKLGEIPRVMNGDEGWMGLVALSTKSNPMANPFSLWENFGGIYLQTINWIISWFGQSSFSLRLLPAISGTLAIPALYLLARQIAGPRVAWIAAALLAMSHSHLNFSRTAAVGYIHDTWIIPLVFFLLLSGLKKESSWRTALAGLLLGLQFCIYLTAQIFIPLVIFFGVIILVFFRKQYPRALGNLLALAGAILVVALPKIVYASRQPAEFFNRLNVDGTFQSGWLAQRMAETGQNAVQILGERVAHAFFALIYYPAIDFYNSPVPLISTITASFFLLGLGIVLWKTRKADFLLLNAYFWGATVAVGVFAVPPSADSYRMIMTLPAVMLFAALGLDRLLSAIGLGWIRSRTSYLLITGFLLANLIFFNVWEYRVDFAGQCRYGGDRQTRFSSYLGSYLHTLRRETTIYLLSDDIFRYGTHASANFLGMQKIVTNVPEPIDQLTLISGDVVIASPNRIEELAAWERQHPGGELNYSYDCEIQIMGSYQVP